MELSIISYQHDMVYFFCLFYIDMKSYTISVEFKFDIVLLFPKLAWFCIMYVDLVV